MTKQITINGMSFELTTERTSRIISSIVETQELLNKELTYREDLQKKEMVDFYRSHIAKLQGMIQ